MVSKKRRPTAKEMALATELKTGAESINQKHQIEALSKELGETKTRLLRIEKEITDFLDSEQREVAAVCHVTNIDYAMKHLRLLHLNRGLIEEVMNIKAISL